MWQPHVMVESSYPAQRQSPRIEAPVTSSDHPDYLAPYVEAIEAFGPGFDATLWASREGQIRRFDLLIDLGDIGAHRVLDVGCGPGDLALRMIEREVPYLEYVGFDAIEAVIDGAGARSIPRSRFEVADVVARPKCMHEVEPDIIVLSGTMNAMEERVGRALLESAWDAAHVGVVFNFLSNRPHPEWADRDLTPARRYDTVDWLDWAMGRTPLVRFSQAYYRGHDATIAMFKSD